jgi:hypothetical protein
MSEFENRPNIVVLFRPQSDHIVGEVLADGGVVIEAQTEVGICNSKSPGFCRACKYKDNCAVTNKLKSP